MADWPQETTIAAFKRAWTLEGKLLDDCIFDASGKMQIKPQSCGCQFAKDL